MFLLELVIGLFLICVTVAIHAFALDRLMHFLEEFGPRAFKLARHSWRTLMLMITALGVFLAHIVQIWLWAVFYYLVGALPDFEACLYFSTSTFTTVGFGDIVLEKENWRLLSSFQSANGFLLFGWSTAFIFEVTSKLYKREQIAHTEKR